MKSYTFLSECTLSGNTSSAKFIIQSKTHYKILIDKHDIQSKGTEFSTRYPYFLLDHIFNTAGFTSKTKCAVNRE